MVNVIVTNVVTLSNDTKRFGDYTNMIKCYLTENEYTTLLSLMNTALEHVTPKDDNEHDTVNELVDHLFSLGA